MFNRALGDPEEIPVPQGKRNYTDCICCVITTVFALALFVLAIIAYTSQSSSTQSNKFSQITGNTTSHDIISFFKSVAGFFLTFLLTIFISLGLGLLWMTIVHCAPLFAPQLALILGLIACVFIAIFTFLIKSSIFESAGWLRYTFAGIAIFTAIILLIYLILYPNELRFQGLFLKYATRFLQSRPSNFWLVLLFILFTFGLIALFVFQEVAFANKSKIFDILNIIQFFWGLKFLQDAFIFIVSGNAVDWYWREDGFGQPCLGFSNLILHNWGSVVVGSLLNLLFKLPLLILELFFCNPTSCCNKCANCCENSCFRYVMNLIRTDSYALINIFGTAYCESSRQCQNFCLDSIHFQGSQSPLRNYRVAVQIFLTTAAFIGSYFILHYRVQKQAVWMIVVLLVTITAFTNYFGSLHASAAEGLMVSFMVQHQLTGEYEYLQRCLPSIRKDLQILARREIPDGTF